MKESGVRFGLGSDVAAGPELCLFEVMKNVSYMQMHDWIAPTELFYLATLGGAKAINMDKSIGSLDAGKEADFIVVDPTRRSSLPFNILKQSSDEILSSLTYLGDDRMVVATYVRGRVIYSL